MTADPAGASGGWGAALILGGAFGVVFFDRNALNFLMPYVLHDIALSHSEIGLAASVLAVAWAVSGFTLARIADRRGRRKGLLLAAVLVFSAASGITGLVRSFAGLLAARILMGLAEGPVLPLSQALIAGEASPARRGLTMGLMQSVFNNLTGSLLAPLILVALAARFGWRAAFSLSALPGLAIALLIALRIHDRPAAPQPRGPGIRRLLRQRNIALCVVISALMVGWQITGWVFLPLYLTRTVGLSATGMSWLMALLGITGAGSGLLVPYLSDRLGRRPVVVLFCLLATLTPIAALALPGAPLLLAGFAAIGWLGAGGFSIFMATIPAESAPLAAVATAMALCMGAGELFGGAAGPAVAGLLADRFGESAPLVTQAVLAVLAGVAALWLRETAPFWAGRMRSEPQRTIG